MSRKTSLILWYTGLLAIILAVFGFTLHTLISFDLNDELDRLLESRANKVQSALATAVALQQTSPSVSLPSADDFASGDLYVQIARPDGTIVNSSSNLSKALPLLPTDVFRQVVDGTSVYSTIKTKQSNLRVYVISWVGKDIKTKGDSSFIIEIARPLGTMQTQLIHWDAVLIGGILAALTIATLGGTLLMRNTLIPIRGLAAR